MLSLLEGYLALRLINFDLDLRIFHPIVEHSIALSGFVEFCHFLKNDLHLDFADIILYTPRFAVLGGR